MEPNQSRYCRVHQGTAGLASFAGSLAGGSRESAIRDEVPEINGKPLSEKALVSNPADPFFPPTPEMKEARSCLIRGRTLRYCVFQGSLHRRAE
jgi:hypothetical protein